MATGEPRRVFLTGATGFIGGRLARRLAQRGDRLRCLVRPGSDTGALQRLGADLVVGEITDGPLLTRALLDVNLAYHLAALYDVGVVDAKALERTNVEGTRAFLGALQQARTPLAIYVSTNQALGPATDQESEPVEADAGPYQSAYRRTKAEAHRLARQAQNAGLPLIVVCPALVYGPGDEGPGGRFIEDLLRGRVPGLLSDPAVFSYVHVDDVVDGLVLAAERGRAGAVYILSGEALTVNDFAERVTQLAGRRAPRLRFPVPLARATALLLDPISRVTGVKFPITRESVATAARHRWAHSRDRASRDLGWSSRPLAQGLPETVAWFESRIRR